MEVHRELGHGFLEIVYKEPFGMELEARGIPYQRETELPLYYKGRQLQSGYRADFICYGVVLVEAKALARRSPVEESQVLNYLKAAKLNRGLLINFGAPSLEYKRFVLNLRESAKSADDSSDIEL